MLFIDILSSRDAADRNPQRVNERMFRNFDGQELPPHLAAIRDQCTLIGDVWDDLQTLSRTQSRFDVQIYSLAMKEAEAIRAQGHAEVGQLLTKFTELYESTKRYVDTEGSVRAMLGALSVENWWGTINRHFVIPSIRRKHSSPDGSLHTALRNSETAQELEAKQLRAQELSNQLEAFDEKYAVSSKYLRNKGALKIVKEVEGWAENGSQRLFFASDGARALIGLAHKLQDEPQKTDTFLTDFSAAKRSWGELKSMKYVRPAKSALLSSAFTLAELYETEDRQLLKNDLMYGLAVTLATKEIHETQPVTQPPITEAEPDRVPVADSIDEEVDQAQEGSNVLEISRNFRSELPIQAFPPDATETDILDDFIGISGDRLTNEPVEWERITALLQLKRSLEELGLNIVSHRMMNSTWHPLPHYVLEVLGPNNRIAVVESPMYGNATYIVSHNEWETIVLFDKKTVRTERDFRGSAHVHPANGNLIDHAERLKNIVRSLL